MSLDLTRRLEKGLPLTAEDYDTNLDKIEVAIEDRLVSADLSYSQSSRALSISSGDGVTLPLATDSLPGLLSSGDKAKLDGIESGAEANVNADWNASSGSAQILNKPSLGSAAFTESSSYATASQGAKADTAVQPATLGSYVQTSDSRLSDAREWTAETIGQAEAETGTATARRAFTAQRVFQAIAAWWAASSAKTKLDGIESGAQVNVGTDITYDASTREVRSSTGSDAVLPLVSSSSAGLAPASGGGTTNFLRADGTWASAGSPPGGSDTQIQFNDGGALGGDPDLTYNKSTNTLSTKGDINLNDGGSFTTTLQTITATANRVISLPDATGTVALVAGSSGQLLWNNSGANAGASTLTYDGSILTTSGRFINSYNSTASSPAKLFSGTWFTGGTSTTTKPQVLIEPAGTTSTAWSTSGTGFGVNAPSGFTGNLLDLQVNGTSQSFFAANGALVIRGLYSDTTGNRRGVWFNATTPDDGNRYGICAMNAGGNPVISIWQTNQPTCTFLPSGSLLQVRDTGGYSWSNSALASDGADRKDLVLYRDAAGTLAQRNGTNAQAFRLYNTLTGTDVSATGNYERGFFRWNSNSLEIGTEVGSGGGTLRPILFPTNAAASTPPLSLTGTWFTGGTATTTKPHFLIEPAGTASTGWSTSGTGLGINAPAGFGGNLLDLRVNGSSKAIISNGTGATEAILTINGATFSNIYNWAVLNNRFIVNSTDNYCAMFSGAIGWANGNPVSASASGFTFIWSDSSYALDQRNGASPNAYRVYNTYTSGTNYERGKLEWSSNVFRVGTEKGSGGGTARAMALQTDGTNRLVADTVGSLQVATALTVATLPSSPLVGMIARVTDATAPVIGSVVAGGGAAAALVWYNGTNWTVLGI